jgi:carbon-monoxide dehydrogenase small subunit
VEGISPNGNLHPVQQALVEQGGIQCGFCTPGMVMAAIALLGDNPHPTEQEVREGLAGNLCRCTGYKKIIEAMMAVNS